MTRSFRETDDTRLREYGVRSVRAADDRAHERRLRNLTHSAAVTIRRRRQQPRVDVDGANSDRDREEAGRPRSTNVRGIGRLASTVRCFVTGVAAEAAYHWEPTAASRVLSCCPGESTTVRLRALEQSASTRVDRKCWLGRSPSGKLAVVQQGRDTDEDENSNAPI